MSSEYASCVSSSRRFSNVIIGVVTLQDHADVKISNDYLDAARTTEEHYQLHHHQQQKLTIMPDKGETGIY